MSQPAMKTVLLLISMLPLAVALTVSVLSASSNIEAEYGQLRVHVNNDLIRGSSSVDGQYDSFHLVLAIKTPASDLPINACFLGGSPQDSTHWAINNVEDIFTSIPVEVGPSGNFYTISAIPFNLIDDYCHAQDDKQTPSQLLNLAHSTSQWSQFEQNSSFHNEHLFSWIPCSDYDCARICNTNNWPSNNDSASNPEDYRSTWDCIAACPYVSLPTFDDFYCNSSSSSSTSTSPTADPSSSTSISPTSDPTQTSTLLGSTVTLNHATTRTQGPPILVTDGPSIRAKSGGIALCGVGKAFMGAALAFASGLLGGLLY